MIIYLTIEATGFGDEDRLCQLAYKTDFGNCCWNEFFKPPLPIKIGAMATHHITEKKVACKPAFVGSTAHSNLVQLIQKPDNIVVAHNAGFNVGLLAKEGVQVPRCICTYRLARALDTKGEAENYSLQYLRYMFGIESPHFAHDASENLFLLEKLFLLYWQKLQGRYATPNEIYQEMLRITQNPILLPKVHFGKYKGYYFQDVPKDFLQWLLKEDFDKDLTYTANYWLPH